MTRRTILLEALASTPNDINRLIRPLVGVDLYWPADWDTQAPWRVIDHLVATEKVYRAHIRFILGESSPDLLSNDYSHAPQEEQRPIGQLGRDFQQARSETLQTLEVIGPGQWQKIAHLEPHGRISLRFLMQRLVEHDIEYTGHLVESVHAWRALRDEGGRSQ